MSHLYYGNDDTLDEISMRYMRFKTMDAKSNLVMFFTFKA